MIKTRFAPSPTGFLHIGGARTALFSYLWAKRNQGEFLLRVEDTDLARNSDLSVQAIFDGMNWLGLNSDEKPVFQSARFDEHRKAALQLLDEGKAYWCYSSPEELEAKRAEQKANNVKPKYDGTWRPEEGKNLPNPPSGVKPVLRFKHPIDGEVVVDDQVKGKIIFQNIEFDDFVILRSDGTPTYNFCVVVDDRDMGITHVVRGDDHINNTPKQINLLKALNAEIPAYAHLGMILNKDGKKFSKRDGAEGVMEYRNMGFLPEAVNSYLLNLGWSNGDNSILTAEQMKAVFDLKHLSPSPARFDLKKLIFVNEQVMRGIDIKSVQFTKFYDEFEFHFRVYGNLSNHLIESNIKMSDLFLSQKDRVSTVKEMVEKSLFFFFDPDYSLVEDKNKAKFATNTHIEYLNKIYDLLSTSEWTKQNLHSVIHSFAENNAIKMQDIAQPLRLAFNATTISPPIDETLFLLGKSKSLSRIEKFVELMKAKLVLKM